MKKGYSKYRAKHTVVDGIRFDSQREAGRYGELLLLAKAGEIMFTPAKGVGLQVPVVS